MPAPTHIVPPVGVNPYRRTAVTPVRVVRVLTQSLGVPDLAIGAGAISGVASTAGVPTAGMIVSLLTDPENVIVRQTLSSVGGVYVFVGLPAGRYQVLVYDPGQDYRSKVIHVEVPDYDTLATAEADVFVTPDGDRLIILE